VRLFDAKRSLVLLAELDQAAHKADPVTRPPGGAASAD
jgi:hypothetical protein